MLLSELVEKWEDPLNRVALDDLSKHYNQLDLSIRLAQEVGGTKFRLADHRKALELTTVLIDYCPDLLKVPPEVTQPIWSVRQWAKAMRQLAAPYEDVDQAEDIRLFTEVMHFLRQLKTLPANKLYSRICVARELEQTRDQPGYDTALKLCTILSKKSLEPTEIGETLLINENGDLSHYRCFYGRDWSAAAEQHSKLLKRRGAEARNFLEEL